MKWDLLAIALFCFIIYRSTKSDIIVRETDKELNTKIQNVVDEKTSSIQDNSISLPGSELSRSVAATSLYKISNNRKAVISTRWPVDKRISFLKNDKPAPKTDLINGGWVNRNNLYSAFSLPKTALK